MKEEELKKYEGKLVLLVLKNNFKITTKIPKFAGNSFSVVDKYQNRVTVDCDMISLVIEQNGKKEGRGGMGGKK